MTLAVRHETLSLAFRDPFRIARVSDSEAAHTVITHVRDHSRGGGIGAAILRAIQDEARDIGKAVSIHVEKNNRARSLYARLGFEVIEDKGVYDLMEWRP